ncbi:MAG: aminoglycoside phosphotransferase family protein [Alphaproteobacteria bacterium]|jgi:streptomycin 6-kinase|nr:aminoglycoside phosphotransferase family protein [Alphaproteobacteria bacterium]
MPDLPPQEILAQFDIANPTFVERTALATVWKVVRDDGQAAALNIYHGTDMRNEAFGFEMLRGWAGRGAAHLYQKSANAALIEWLGGISLGDLSRGGEDEKANMHLVDIANQLHSRALEPIPGIPTLDSWFSPLLCLRFARTCPRQARKDLENCKTLARDLLASQSDMVVLHGDLHHDNIRLGERGYCAFDAKGVLGERAYELANAVRNPKGADKIVNNPHRIRRLLDSWAASFAVDRRRLAQWAAVKCALSIAWRASGPLETDPEFELLSKLLHISQE